MLSNKVLHYLDKLLRDVCNKNKIFGGKCILLGGDWKQLPPVVEHGTREDQIKESIKVDPLFYENFKTLRYVIFFIHLNLFSLTTNKRADANEDELLEWLDIIGNGKGERMSNSAVKLDVREEMICKEQEDIINFCFPPNVFANPFGHADELADNALLCPTNIDVQAINDIAMARMTGEGMKHEAINTPLQSSNEYGGFRCDCSPEVMEQEMPSGFPPQSLWLKVCSIALGLFCFLEWRNYYAYQELGSKEWIVQWNSIAGCPTNERIDLRQDYYRTQT